MNRISNRIKRKLSEELRERGFIKQFSGESLEVILDTKNRTFFLGVDPTAGSLHAGNLMQYMLVRHLADAGNTPILLVGGGTGMIGDPKDTSERPLSNSKEVKRHTKKIRNQVENLIGKKVKTVNNADWLTKLNFIDFMRDIGKHFTINSMIKREIVAKRLADENPISYTEFAYAPMQAYDFLHLYRKHNCTLQTGGSDQWGNIISGVELVRKKEGSEVFAIATPLIVDKITGRKFGKSEGNAVWLDSNMTSPYAFYQFWLNVDDMDVIERLKIFTLLTLEEIAKLEKLVNISPAERKAQKTLAYEVTKFVHGKNVAEVVKNVSEILFGNKNLEQITVEEIKILKTEAPTIQVEVGDSIIDILVNTKLATSKSAARKLIEAGGISINDTKIQNIDYKLNNSEFKNRIAILHKGKKHLYVLLQK